MGPPDYLTTGAAKHVRHLREPTDPFTNIHGPSDVVADTLGGRCSRSDRAGSTHRSFGLPYGVKTVVTSASGEPIPAMTSRLKSKRSHTDLIVARETQPIWPATEVLVKQVSTTWLHHAGIDSFAQELSALGPLDLKADRLHAVSILGRATLIADIAAVGVVTEAIQDRDHDERVKIIAMLGQSSSEAWQLVEGPVRQAVIDASNEQHLAHSLVNAAQTELALRQSDPKFASWIASDPDGLAGHAWTIALRVASERLWNRNWAKVAELGTLPSRVGAATCGPLQYQPGVLRLQQATRIAHEAAIQSIMRSTMQSDAALRTSAWDDAVAAAQKAPGAEPWSADINATRAGVGEAAWAAANQSARATVQVVVNELPHVVGRIALISLAAEVCSASARAVAISAGLDTLDPYDDLEEAEKVATSSMASAVVSLCA